MFAVKMEGSVDLHIVVVAESQSAVNLLQQQADRVHIGKVEFGLARMNSDEVRANADLIARAQPDVFIIDLPAKVSDEQWAAIESLKALAPDAGLFMVGVMEDARLIVRAMQAGGTEYLSKPLSLVDLEAAYARLPKLRSATPLGKLIAVVNAKPGSGATTVAVNTALKLQMTRGNAALVDLAPLGHAGLFLNAAPRWSILDLLMNLERADATSLPAWMTVCRQGLSLLAGAPEPVALDLQPTHLGTMFTLLLSKYSFVVVDLSSRYDEISRFLFRTADQVLLVSQSDVSLQQAQRIRGLLGHEVAADRVCLVVNRCRELGRAEREAVVACDAALSCNIPNQFQAMAAAIARGVPVVEQGPSQMANAFSRLLETFMGDEKLASSQGILSPLANAGLHMRLNQRMAVSGS